MVSPAFHHTEAAAAVPPHAHGTGVSTAADAAAAAEAPVGDRTPTTHFHTRVPVVIEVATGDVAMAATAALADLLPEWVSAAASRGVDLTEIFVGPPGHRPPRPPRPHHPHRPFLRGRPADAVGDDTVPGRSGPPRRRHRS